MFLSIRMTGAGPLVRVQPNGGRIVCEIQREIQQEIQREIQQEIQKN